MRAVQENSGGAGGGGILEILTEKNLNLLHQVRGVVQPVEFKTLEAWD
jgi:hypothetical protein